MFSSSSSRLESASSSHWANLFGYNLDLLADPDTNTFPEFFTVYGHSAAPRTSAVAPQVAAGLTQAE
jgi:hypothetical protein